MCARLDGVDPISDHPVEMLLYAVYRRRLMSEALRTRALLMATLNPEQAADAAKAYFEVSVPVSSDEQLLHDLEQARRLDAVDALGVIPMTALRPAGSRAIKQLDQLAGLRR